ncbi:hypothetical protein [Ruegeria arenilitoris]|uniref:hypothetical protein n=1 Tax=Ruegeria arenilitoris TaxID=1173585 RepID=UPI00147C6377|nr:hypothetical protein [Ruegeria arenilitoris]
MTDNMELWKKSHWLSKSKKSYAQHFFRDEWQAIVENGGDVPWHELFRTSMEDTKASGKLGMEAFEHFAGRIHEKENPRTKLLERAEHEIKKYLLDGTYRGYGFDRPRNLETEPVLIPAECWKGVVSWADNEVSYQSLKFREVRVRMMRENRDPILKKPFEAPVRKVGRPTVGPAIEEAFHALLKIKEIDPAASQMSHYPKVKKWLEIHHADLNVPPASISDKTIQKYFSLLFNTLRKKSKTINPLGI